MNIDDLLALSLRAIFQYFSNTTHSDNDGSQENYFPCNYKVYEIDGFLALGMQGHISIFCLWLSCQRFPFIKYLFENRWYSGSRPPRPYFDISTMALKTTRFLYKVYENRWFLGSRPPRPYFNILTMPSKTTIFHYKAYENR